MTSANQSSIICDKCSRCSSRVRQHIDTFRSLTRPSCHTLACTLMCTYRDVKMMLNHAPALSFHRNRYWESMREISWPISRQRNGSPLENALPNGPLATKQTQKRKRLMKYHGDISITCTCARHIFASLQDVDVFIYYICHTSFYISHISIFLAYSS